MIEVRSLSKSYGDRKAIDNLNFKVGKGEVVGFLGPNGAGKTTTMKIITGFMAPTSGQATVAGFDVFENPIEAKRQIGYLPETPPLYGDLIVRDYLAFVARLKGTPKAKVRSMVDRAIEKTQLTAVAGRLIQNLSKGFRQRVGLAQAIVNDPAILILDEPTVGLDPKQVAEIRGLLQELRGSHTIILSTHILPEVQSTCERVIIINNGRIVAEDTLADLGKKMSKGSARIHLRVRRKTDELIRDLQSLAGVTQVEDFGAEIKVHGMNTEEFIESVSDCVANRRAGLLELSPSVSNLEEVFIQLTSV